MSRHLMLIVCLSFAGTAGAGESTEVSRLRAEIERILNETRTPAASIALVRNHQIEWAAGIGTADLATGRKADVNSLFRIGSVSKGFVALAALKLQEQGILDLNAPLAELAPEIPCENQWEGTDPVRFVHLLEHTAGWSDASLRVFALDTSDEATIAQCVELTREARSSRWKPGTRYSYSNVGPTVAAYVIEKITGERFEDFVRRTWFVPLEMADCSYFGSPAVLQRLAIGYHRNSITPYPYWKFAMRPAGSINASPRGMANYVLFHVERGRRNGVALLSETSMERMEMPTTTYAARQGLKVGYGLGNYAEIHEGWVYHGHDGDALGSRTAMAYIPSAGVGYAFTINSDDGAAFSRVRQTIESYLTRELPKPSPVASLPVPAEAARYAGWYEPINPRFEYLYAFERWSGLMYARWAGKVFETKRTNAPIPITRYFYSGEQLLRGANQPMPTLALVRDLSEGTLIQDGESGTTYRRVSSLALRVRIGFAVAATLVMATAPFVGAIWFIRRVTGRLRFQQTRWLRVIPFASVLSIVGFVIFYFGALDVRIAIHRYGQVTPWSLGLFIFSILVPIFSLAGFVESWRLRGEHMHRGLRWYALLVSLSTALASAYLFESGLLAIRTWI